MQKSRLDVVTKSGDIVKPTEFLHAACDDRADRLQSLIRLVKPETAREMILQENDTQGGTVLHYAVKKSVNHIKAVLQPFDHQSKAEKLQLLRTTDNRGQTAFHEAANEKSHDMLKFLLESVDTYKQRCEILLMDNVLSETALHNAVRQSLQHVKLILSFYVEGSYEKYRLLSAGEETVFHSYNISRSTPEIYRFLLESVGNLEHLHDLLGCYNCCRDGPGETVICDAVKQSEPDYINCILNLINVCSPEGFELLLRKVGYYEQPILPQVRTVEVMSTIRDRLTADQWLVLLTETDNRGESSFHYIMRGQYANFVKYILENLQPDDRLRLLKIEYSKGCRPMDGLSDFISPNNYEEKMKKVEIVQHLLAEEDGLGLIQSLFEKTVSRLPNTVPPENGYRLIFLQKLLDNMPPALQLRFIGEREGLETQLRGMMTCFNSKLHEHIKLLQDYRTDAKVALAIAENNKQGNQCQYFHDNVLHSTNPL